MAVSVEQANRLEEALAGLSFRQVLNILIVRGVPAVHIMGLERCREHYGWFLMGDYEPLAFDGSVRYCGEGMHWVRCSS
jgi:hypothetical protein